MNNHSSETTVPTLPEPFRTQLLEAFSRGLVPVLERAFHCPCSDAEALIAHVLHLLLYDFLRTGDLRLVQQVRITDPTLSASHYSGDLMIEQWATGARLIVSTYGFSVHGRTPDEFDKEHRRRREIERLGYSYISFSAREVRRNPWAASLEVLHHINHVARGFAQIHPAEPLLETVRANARASSSATTGRPPLQPPTSYPPVRGEDSTHLADPAQSTESLLAQVADEFGRSQPRVAAHHMQRQQVRSVHRRDGEPWLQREEQWLKRLHLAGYALHDVAGALGRTIGAIRRRLVRLGLISEFETHAD